jgi:hypothetical protein
LPADTPALRLLLALLLITLAILLFQDCLSQRAALEEASAAAPAMPCELAQVLKLAALLTKAEELIATALQLHCLSLQQCNQELRWAGAAQCLRAVQS